MSRRNEQNFRKDQDPFLKQVEAHYYGLLKKYDHISEETLIKHIEFLVNVIQSDFLEKFFNKHQDILHEIIYDRLISHVQEVSARALLNFEDEDRIPFNQLIQTADCCDAINTRNPLWAQRENLHQVCNVFDPFYTHRDQTNTMLTEFFDGNTENLYGRKHYIELSEPLQKCLSELLNEENESYHESLTQIEEKITEETLYNSSEQVKTLESEKPGAYIVLLVLLHNEKYRITYFSNSQEEEITALNKFIDQHALSAGIEALEDSKYLNIAYQFRNVLRENIVALRLELYIKALREREFNEIWGRVQADYDNEYNQWLAECREIDEDHDGAEYDYDGVVYPPEPLSPLKSSVQMNLYYGKPEFENITNISNLIKCSSGEENLDWLLYQILEFETETPEELFSALDLDNLAEKNFPVENIDRQILEAVLHALYDERQYQVNKMFQEHFIRESFLESLAKLLPSVGNPISLNSSSIFEKLKKTLKEKYASAKILIENGNLQRLREDYNNAFTRNDWLNRHKYWAIFTKFQRLLKSTNPDSENHPKRGRDYNFTRKPRNYEDLLNEAYEAYEKRVEQNFHRICPMPSTHFVSYGQRGTDGYTEKNILPLLTELRDTGRAIKKILNTAEATQSKQKSAKSTNVVVPLLLFAIAQQPFNKGDQHDNLKKIFLAVPLMLRKYNEKLLSRSSCDQVMASDNYEDMIPAAQRDIEAAYPLVHNASITPEEARRKIKMPNNLCHSERVLFAALNDEENCEEIANDLAEELRIKLGDTTEAGIYYVYSSVLMLYSTNSICENCSLAIVAQQNSHRAGFLNLLISKINETERNGVQLSIPENIRLFRLLTVALSETEFTQQANDIVDEQKEEGYLHKTSTHNPKSKIYFSENTIPLDQVKTDENGEPAGTYASFIEYVKSDFSMYASSRDNTDYVHLGKSFMSKSKTKGKPYSNPDKINQCVNEIMSAKIDITI